MSSARRRYERYDPVLITCVVLLALLGSVMVFSSSAILAEFRKGNPLYFLKRHLFYLILGGTAGFAAARIRPDFWKKHWAVLFAGTAFFLILTLLIGKKIGGARRWLYVGPLGFQFSELAKLAMVVAIAWYLDRFHSRIGQFKWALLYPAGLFFSLVLPIVLEPDFGNPLVIGIVFYFMLLLGGLGRVYALLPLALSIPAAGYLIAANPYRIQRLTAFFSLWSAQDLGKGGPKAAYQASQGLLALGSGGLFGKGLGESQLKLHYLPQPHTDFIFPVIGEEFGFLGSFIVVALFVFLLARGIRAAHYARNLFEQQLALGISLCLSFQAAIHLAVTTALVPTKGITLPFMSYGGSSLVMSCLMAGILIRISRSEH